MDAETLSAANDLWMLVFSLSGLVGPCQLLWKPGGQLFADAGYQAQVEVVGWGPSTTVEYSQERSKRSRQRGQLGTLWTIKGQLKFAGGQGLPVRWEYFLPEEGDYFTENIILCPATPIALKNIDFGWRVKRSTLAGYRCTPIPFRLGLDGQEKWFQVDSAVPGYHFAEGWAVDNGQEGMLIMREPSPDCYTCFVSTEVTADQLLLGGIGAEGTDAFTRNLFLDVPFAAGEIRLPTTRYLHFQGDWQTGYYRFRQTLNALLRRKPEQSYAGLPVTYNSFHDFGPNYDRESLFELLPDLRAAGIGLLHLDPGWETAWGSNAWNDAKMSTPADFIREVGRRWKMEVGCWTSVHTADPEVQNPYYIRDTQGQKYYAEDFAKENPAGGPKLWGVCPASGWKDKTLAQLTRVGKGGLRFLNSDFHDWPWNGESCHDPAHGHRVPLYRAEWARALNEFYRDLHRQCPKLTIEVHDYFESGGYHSPLWYLYDLPHSYDERWAYEFMWTTYDDLMQHKLFSLYYLRLAESIPLYLHINMGSDNDNALAFWYMASCVQHIGIGGFKHSKPAVREAYRRAIAFHNANRDYFTRGEFYGVDELTHVHLHPDRRSLLLLVYNLEQQPVTRDVSIPLAPMPEQEAGTVTSDDFTARVADGAIKVENITIPPQSCRAGIIRLGK